MIILTPTNWTDYQLLDSGDGKRLERFGKYILIRPDPQCLWKPSQPASEWQKADAVFRPDGREKGQWVKNKKLPNTC
jgi:23S rRNA (cytosine1962-C5)-methyltransferase